MKINQVEELVGITKKNIRFYEEQGLLHPKRDPNNGYREYNLEDVALLNKIKLLRKLDVSIEDILRLENEGWNLEECLQKHFRTLSDRQKNLEVMKEMCAKLSNQAIDFSSLAAEDFLEEMDNLEKGGTVFVNVKEEDVKKTMERQKKTGTLLACFAMTLIFGGLMGLFFWLNSIDPAPTVLVVIIAGTMGAALIGVWVATYKRLKEIKGGEEYEASKY